jgi:hypothetical protein
MTRTRLGALVLLGACAPGLPHASASDAAMARERRPDVTVGELEHGRTLYIRRCANCHTLKDPASVSAREWPAKIAEMQAEHGVELHADEAELITTYLYALSRRAGGKGVAAN